MSNDVVLQINATIGKAAAEAEVGDLEAKVKASMVAVIRGNWMATTDDALFRAGIGGALLAVGPDSDAGRSLKASIDILRKFNAFVQASQAGLSVSLADALETDEDAPPTVPLMQWWQDVRTAHPDR